MSTEQDNTPAPDEMPGKPGKEAPRLRTFPPLRNFVIAGTFLAIGLTVWLAGALRDHAIENIVLMICTLAAVLTPVVWYTFVSRWPSRKRYIPLLTVVIVLFGPFALGRFREVNGEMIPSRWTWWWEKTPDQQLADLPSPPEDDVAPPAPQNTRRPTTSRSFSARIAINICQAQFLIATGTNIRQSLFGGRRSAPAGVRFRLSTEVPSRWSSAAMRSLSPATTCSPAI